MDWREHIVSDKEILLGKPCVKGTRLSVEFIVQLFASGWTTQEILENYPTLKVDTIQAVFAYIYENIHDNLFIRHSITSDAKIAG
jgi:uncharacterized protein (DUF433 family)